MEDEVEVWLPVVGYEGLYEVSDRGRVRSLDTVKFNWRGTCLLKGKLLSPRPGKYGYMRVDLRSHFDESNHRTLKGWLVHRLVATAHIRPPLEGEEVNHIDFNPSNNAVSNLSWCSRKGNMEHSALHGRLHGAIPGRSKLTTEQVAEIVSLGKERRFTHKDLADMYGVSTSNIGLILNGKSWAYGDQRDVRVCEPKPRVSNAHSAKLTEDDVKWIRCAGSSKRLSELSEMFGVSQGCISQLRLGKTWAHVT